MDAMQVSRKPEPTLSRGYGENEIRFHFHRSGHTIEQVKLGRQERTGITNYRSARLREGEW